MPHQPYPLDGWHEHDLVWLAARALQDFEASMDLVPPVVDDGSPSGCLPLTDADRVKAERLSSGPYELSRLDFTQLAAAIDDQRVESERGNRQLGAVMVVADALRLGLLDQVPNGRIRTGHSYDLISPASPWRNALPE
jgi:hypothetical protein